MAKKLTHEELLQSLEDMDSQLWPTEKYVNNTTKINWECSLGHSVFRSPKLVKRQKGECKQCKGTAQTNWNYNSLLHKLEEVGALNEVVPITKFSKISEKVEWQCLRDDQHSWTTTVVKIIGGTRCPHCASNHQKDINYYITWFSVNMPGYEVLRLPGNQSTSLAKIKCPKGHIWEQTFRNIEKAKQKVCPECYSPMRSFAQVKLDLKNLHKINYEPLEMYIDYNKPIPWKCSKGHIWETSMNSIVCGSSCPICYRTTKEIFYILQYKDRFKVGISNNLRTFNNRLNSIGLPEYKVMLVLQLYNAAELEKSILTSLEMYRYTEREAKTGYTEFLQDISFDHLCLQVYDYFIREN